MAKKKPLEIKIPVEDENTLKAISDAHGIANYYRAKQTGAPVQSLEKFLMGFVIQGVNALFSYHDHCLKQEEQAAATKPTDGSKSSIEEMAEEAAQEALEEVVAEMKAEEMENEQGK